MGRLARSGIRLDDTDRIVMDLNEENVQEIFERCLADENTTEKRVGLLFPQALGWNKEDDQTVYFDKAKIKKDEKSIHFLYGQVASWDQDARLTPKSVSKKYTGEVWTRNSGIIMEFLYLGNAIGIVTPFNKETQYAAHICTDPTLSPNDPNFPEWWKEHKPEWEGKRIGGIVYID
ncbi:MAG: hypothetical protein LUH48_04080 [Clostridiales bacterium]|nr:hypothetical protein [Clostridiales bacterium]